MKALGVLLHPEVPVLIFFFSKPTIKILTHDTYRLVLRLWLGTGHLTGLGACSVKIKLIHRSSVMSVHDLVLVAGFPTVKCSSLLFHSTLFLRGSIYPCQALSERVASPAFAVVYFSTKL